MDFRKVENIFLITFLLLNIYLLISYLNRTDIQQASTAPGQVNLIREMEQLGINLPNLTEEQPEVYYIQADSHQLLEENANQLENQAGSIDQEGTLYTSILSAPIELDGDLDEGFTAEDFDTLDAFVNSDAILFGEEYAFLRFDRDQNRFIYAQEVQGMPIADGTSQISLFYGSDGEIISYQQTYAGPTITQGSPQAVLSNRRAVEILYENHEISSNSTVNQPVLTYHRTLYLEDLSMYGPVWYVPVSDASGERVLRVDAFEGTIISQPTAPTTPQEPEDVEDEPDDEDN
ncbi:hypothetical protein GCM10008932_21380 [Alkalibacterium iburiense]|uniref:Regulatory protein YycH-like domain-containing protein n=1 Tax=Alkalibacterium iburiense TaxID=290589 RepID=A0ABN0XPN5_9LACT